MSNNIIIDLNGIAFAVYHKAFPNGKGFTKSLFIHQIITTLSATDRKFGSSGVLIAADSPYVWRREIYPEYKANRKLTRDPNYDEIKEAIISVKEFFNKCTSIPVLAVERCEADDIIAGAVHLRESLASQTDIMIVSADKDFVQLIRPGVRLYSPTQKKERVCEDPKYALFEKCIRGDTGDNIFSAYPRVRSTKLLAAYQNPVDMMNLMNTKVNDDKRVGDVYELNKTLIDLSQQPQDIKKMIRLALLQAMSGFSTYNQIGCLRYFGENNMVKLADELASFKGFFKKTFSL